MKTKLKLACVAIVLSLISFVGRAQTAISVGDLVLEEKYSDSKISEMVGARTLLAQTIDGNSISQFSYKDNMFFTNNEILYCVVLTNGQLKLNNLVGVGDNIDEIAKIDLILAGSEDVGEGTLHYTAYSKDDHRKVRQFTFSVKDNVIERITYLNHDELYEAK